MQGLMLLNREDWRDNIRIHLNRQEDGPLQNVCKGTTLHMKIEGEKWTEVLGF